MQITSTVVVLLIGAVSAFALELNHAKATAKTGHKVNLDIAMDSNTMIMVTKKTQNSDEKFVETTNLHVFNRRLAAARDSVNNRCYVQASDVTKAAMQEEMTLIKEGVLNEVPSFDEERINLSELTCRPLTSSSMKLLFGEEIASFCDSHDTYFLDDHSFTVLQHQDVASEESARHRRQTEISINIGISIKI